MASLNYMERFADDVESGRKRQTIRARRKRPIKLGERLHHFTGMRTKNCRRLRAKQQDQCTWTRPIKITETTGHGNTEFDRLAKHVHVFVAGVEMNPAQVEDLALRDGFTSAFAFVTFFMEVHPLPFDGDIIRW